MTQGYNVATYMVADPAVPKGSFQNNGMLDDTAVDFNGSASIAISCNLGSIQATQDPIVWAVGLITDPVLNYYTDLAGAHQQRSLYFKTQYVDEKSLVCIHIHQ